MKTKPLKPANEKQDSNIKTKTMNKNIKVFELDFGDTNLLSEKPEEITEWIKNDMLDMGDADELNYTIKIRRMSQRQIDNLPEWS